MSQSAILGLPFIQSAQAQKHVTHNEAIEALDAIVQLSVLDRDLATPPATPNEGDRYLVAAGGASDWSGRDGLLAVWRNGAWAFVEPLEGWQAWVADEDLMTIYNGSAWGAAPIELQNVPGLGVNATSDATNKLAIAADATLLNHNGNGHQLKLNKASTGDTASVLFQDNWSGRAEMGLAGDADFSIKVSADGSGFDTALRCDATTATTAAKAVYSGTIVVADDAIGDVSIPADGGFILINTSGAADHSAIFVHTAGATPSLMSVFTGPSAENAGTTTLTGTTSPDGVTGFALNAGALQIENRSGAALTFSYTFIGI